MDSNPLTVCRSNADCVIGAADGVAVALWVHQTRPEDVAALAEAAGRARRGPHRWVKLIQIVPDTAITPDAHARTALARMLRGLLGVVSHSVIVHEADGFRAAMVRSIVTGVAALSNPGFPHRVFARLPDAIEWMCEGATVPGARSLEMRQIEATVRQLRTGAARGGATPGGLTKERAPTLDCR